MKVHITQCLCPQRHCMLAMAWEEPHMTPKKAESTLQEIIDGGVARGLLRKCCGVCGSSELRCEDGLTQFDSLEEAEGEIVRLQAENLKTRRMLDALKN